MGRARDDVRGARRRSASRSRSATRGGGRRDGGSGSRRRTSASRSRSRSRSRSADRRPRHRESERSRRHRNRPRDERRRHRDDRSRSRSREPRKRRRRADSRADEKKKSRRDSSADKKEPQKQALDAKKDAVSGKEEVGNGTKEPEQEATPAAPAGTETHEPASGSGQKDGGTLAGDAAFSADAGGDIVMEEARETSPVKENGSGATPFSSQEQPKPSVPNAAAAAAAAAALLSTASAPATAASSAPATPPTSTVDVKSIKLDILKALAEARSTIAGIKGVTTASKPTDSSEGDKPAVQPPNGVTLPSEQHKPQSPKKKLDQDHPAAPPASEKKPEEEAASLPQKIKAAPASAAEEFDMFAVTDLDDDEVVALQSGPVVPTIDVAGLQLNCDDADGYYNTTVGEVLNGKYRVLGSVGKGVFSTVLRCQCVPPLPCASGAIDVVAVKLIRNNDVMREAAQTEVRLLNELAAKDPRDKKHCVRLLDTFSHRSHVALVFEPMEMNLREAMKKFGGKSGISIQAVRVFSKHLLIALNHLDACGIIHADIKPDNILLDEKQTTIKLCDFGSAFKVADGKQDPTPYLVSRFYRAPEIVLGLAYDKAVDMWSVGCCLFEMFTGKVMFPGSTNNEMLKLFMELKGKIPNKLIKKHRQAYIDQFQIEPHFTEDMKFCSRESDRVTGKPLLRLMETIKTKNDLAGALMAAKSATDDRKQVLELKSLLDRMFTLDPAKRISVREALAHPFIKG